MQGMLDRPVDRALMPESRGRGNLGDEEGGQGIEKRGGKEDEGHRHALEHAELGQPGT